VKRGPRGPFDVILVNGAFGDVPTIGNADIDARNLGRRLAMTVE